MTKTPSPHTPDPDSTAPSFAPPLTVYHDLTDPYSYLLAGEIEQLEDEGRVVRWLPFENRPAPTLLPPPRDPALRREWRESVYPLADIYGTEIHMPVVIPRAAPAHAAESFAEEVDAGRAWRRAVRIAYFIEGLDVSAERVLRWAAGLARIDPEAILVAAYDPERVSRIAEIREEALAQGVVSAPTVLEAGRPVFRGAPGPGLLRLAINGEARTP